MEQKDDGIISDRENLKNYYDRAAERIRDLVISGGLDKVRELYPDAHYVRLKDTETKSFMQESMVDLPDTDYYFNGSANIVHCTTNYEPTHLQGILNRCFNGDDSANLQVASFFAHEVSGFDVEQDKALRFGANVTFNRVLGACRRPPRGIVICEPRIEDLRRIRKSFDANKWSGAWEKVKLFLIMPKSVYSKQKEMWMNYINDRVDKSSVVIYETGESIEERVSAMLDFSEQYCTQAGPMPDYICYSNFRIGEYIDCALRDGNLFGALRNVFARTWQLHHGPIFLEGKESHTFDLQTAFKVRSVVARHKVVGTHIGDYVPELALTSLGRSKYVDFIVPNLALGAFNCSIVNGWNLFNSINHGYSVNVQLNHIQRYLECMGFMTTLPVSDCGNLHLVKPYPVMPSDLQILAWNKMIIQPKLDGFPLILEGDGDSVKLAHPHGTYSVMVGQCKDRFRIQCEYVPQLPDNIDTRVKTFLWEALSYAYGHAPGEFLTHVNWASLYLVHCLEFNGIIPIGVQECNYRRAFMDALVGFDHDAPFGSFEVRANGLTRCTYNTLNSLWNHRVRQSIMNSSKDKMLKYSLFEGIPFTAMNTPPAVGFQFIRNNEPFFIPTEGVSDYISKCEEGVVLINPLEPIDVPRAIMAVKRRPTDDLLGVMRMVEDVKVTELLQAIGRMCSANALIGLAHMIYDLPLFLVDKGDGGGEDVVLEMSYGMNPVGRDLTKLLRETHLEVDSVTGEKIRTRYDKNKRRDSLWPRDACTLERVYATLLQPYRSQIISIDKSITVQEIMDFVLKMRTLDTFDEEMALSRLGRILLANTFMRFSFDDADPRYAILAEMHMIFRQLFLTGSIPFRFIAYAGVGGIIRFLNVILPRFGASSNDSAIPSSWSMSINEAYRTDLASFVAPSHLGAPDMDGVVYLSNNYPKTLEGDICRRGIVCDFNRHTIIDVQDLPSGHPESMAEFYKVHARHEPFVVRIPIDDDGARNIQRFDLANFLNAVLRFNEVNTPNQDVLVQLLGQLGDGSAGFFGDAETQDVEDDEIVEL